MNRSAHPALNISACERRQTQLIMEPAQMQPVLSRVLESHCSSVSVDCVLIDAKYQPTQHCLALYQYHGAYVTVMACWSPDSPFFNADKSNLDTKTDIQIFPFPNDPLLPGLPCAADSVLMTRMLEPLLQKEYKKTCMIDCRVTPVRYRPCQRCTFCVQLAIELGNGRIDQHVLYAKVFDDPRELDIVGQAMQLLDNFHNRLDNLSVAVPLGSVRKERILLQKGKRGDCLERLVEDATTVGKPSHDVCALISGVAAGIASIHALPIAVPRKRDLMNEARAFSQGVNTVASVCRPLYASMHSLISALLGRTDITASLETRCFTHGDFKPNQIIVDGRQMTCLDFDGCAMSDRALDVATFIATLRQIRVRQSLNMSMDRSGEKNLHILETLFLDQYCTAAFQGHLFRQKVIWCQALALLRKALRAFYRDPASPVPTALITEAHQCVQSLSQ